MSFQKFNSYRPSGVNDGVKDASYYWFKSMAGRLFGAKAIPESTVTFCVNYKKLRVQPDYVEIESGGVTALWVFNCQSLTT